MSYKMLVDVDRCIGCWTCAMGCKVGNHLADDEFRIEVETKGSGAGIDRPAGVYPDLHMSWQPIYRPTCTFCAERTAEALPPFCVMDCPTQALAFGNVDDPESGFSQALLRVKELGAQTYELEASNTRANVVYARRG